MAAEIYLLQVLQEELEQLTGALLQKQETSWESMEMVISLTLQVEQ